MRDLVGLSERRGLKYFVWGLILYEFWQIALARTPIATDNGAVTVCIRIVSQGGLSNDGWPEKARICPTRHGCFLVSIFLFPC